MLIRQYSNYPLFAQCRNVLSSSISLNINSNSSFVSLFSEAEAKLYNFPFDGEIPSSKN
jgi:hypothetical protein